MSPPREETAVVLKICLGQGSRFNGMICEYFIKDASECDLLKNGSIKSVYENGRCLSLEEIHNRTENLLEKYERKGEFIDLKVILYGRNPSNPEKGGLLNARLNNPTLTSLYSFVNRSIYNEVAQTLRSRGIFSDRKQCGSCEYLAAGNPRTCRLESIQDPKTGEFIDNRFFGQDRKSSDQACDGYSHKDTRTQSLDETHAEAFSISKPGSPVSATVEAETQNIENCLIAKLDFELLVEKLIERVVNAASTKQKEIAQRQFDLVTRLCQLFRDNEDEAMKVYLDEISSDPKQREAYRKRTERDLQEIGNLFLGKMSGK